LKSNIGHTQAAAGVGGVIKTVLALRNGVMPKTLHAEHASTKVDWTSGAVSLLTDAREWSRNGHPRRAGVSAFGFSGTNAHVILEEAPESVVEDTQSTHEASVVPWVLSGRSADAVRGQAGRLASFVAAGGVSDVDVALSLVTSRSVFEHRAVVFGADRAELLAKLDVLPVMGRASTGKTAFLFAGQGS